MKLNKLSANFTPLNEGIIFSINTENEVPTNLIVEIIDAKSNEIVATQQLHNATTATVNIAPYIACFSGYAPTSLRQTAFMEAPTATYKIRINDIESEAVVVSVNRTKIDTKPTGITALPLSRRITRHANDELMIVSEAGKTIYAEIVADNGETLHFEYTPTTEASILAISPDDFDSVVKTFDVALYCEGEAFCTLHYSITTPLKTATRLAWISDNGTIERYTFPVSHKAKRSAEKRTITTQEGVVAARCNAKQTTSLCSRFESRATIEALAQIASAPKVWIEQGEGWRLVEVIELQTEYNLFDEPSHLHLDICLWKKEVAL